jgi:hypothetical protein
MYRLRWILLGLFAIGWIASEWPHPTAAVVDAQQGPAWRRTVDGWERLDLPTSEPPGRTAAPDPRLLLGIQLIFLGLAALAASHRPAASPAADRAGDH